MSCVNAAADVWVKLFKPARTLRGGAAPLVVRGDRCYVTKPDVISPPVRKASLTHHTADFIVPNNKIQPGVKTESLFIGQECNLT